MRKIIALAGPAQSGKSTIASYLKTHNFIEDSFAAPIRHCVANILGITLEQLEICKEQHLPPFDFTPRRMMQTLGTEWGRQMMQDNLWVVSLQERIEQRDPNQSLVISDLRFENEAIALRDLGAEIWHIERPRTGIASIHISEAGIMHQLHDYVLTNDGTLLNLFVQINDLIGESE